MHHFFFSLLFALFPALLFAQLSSSTPDAQFPGAGNDPPKIVKVNVTPEACDAVNGSIQIQAISQSGTLQYAIDGNSFQLSDRFNDLKAGQYTVAVMDESGRITTQVANLPSSDKIEVSSINIIPSICTDNTGAIKVLRADDSSAYVFSLNGGRPQNDSEFTSLAPGSYALHIANEAGCSLDTSLIISKEACPVYIPNIFSPNGDGVNDLFRLQAPVNQNITITRFFIFDSWGNSVYEKFNLPVHAETGWWDGTYKRFTANPGMFAYYVEVQFENGDRETYKGKVTLIR